MMVHTVLKLSTLMMKHMEHLMSNYHLAHENKMLVPRISKCIQKYGITYTSSHHMTFATFPSRDIFFTFLLFLYVMMAPHGADVSSQNKSFLSGNSVDGHFYENIHILYVV